MNECLSTDAILTIGDALGWDVQDGLCHLQTCEECRAQMEVLRLARSGFVETEPVDAAVLWRIATAVGAAARSEQQRARAGERWTQSIEAFLAGISVLIILVSSGIQVDDVGTAALGFALGATLMVCSNMFARNVPASAQESVRA